MIRCARLHCPPGSQFRVADPFPFAHDLPLLVALEAAEDPQDVVLWADPENGVVGLFQPLGRTAWRLADVVGLNAVLLRPGDGPGATGLELILKDGREAPVVITRPFREDLVEWLNAQLPRIEEVLGLPVRWVDYGEDR